MSRESDKKARLRRKRRHLVWEAKQFAKAEQAEAEKVGKKAE